ncbi:hypothetical protein EYE40_08840 [Glaciihabitans arcticus]|uniref:Uncharacterized protein n=1 Tax=Glaciihabitans arcticus TaxID=2668039 RepID=A0A4Q9GRC2_9MICO|nr:hypothetical protein [Glaciihabitans arcticus]TBN57486.1 hypothetical protein EYE40_08840 [Glaciihabitans arcticus]
MNIGRVIVGGSAVLALAAGTGFVATVFSPSDLQADAGGMCADSNYMDDVLVGMPISNNSKDAIELTSARVESLEGVTVKGTWINPIDGSGNNVGSVEYSPEAMDTYALHPVGGTMVPPGETTNVVFGIATDDGLGRARDFSVDYIGNYGISHTRTATGVFGFSRGNTESEECTS